MLEGLRQIRRASRQRLHRPTHAGVLAGDAIRLPYLTARDLYKFTEDRSTAEHLEGTMGWLCRAQDATPDRGVSTAYDLSTGWMASYPETTGYIVTTFFDYADHAGEPDYRRRAVEMADWLVSIQLDGGAFQAGPVDKAPEPSVFNSGQILLGLARAYRETSDDRYLDSARRCADWLASVQDPDGAWRQFAYLGIPHVYYTRVAWAMLEVGAIADDRDYAETARRQLEWALSHQRPSGWFAGNGFDGKSNPFTHNIVYAAEGLFGAGKLLGERRYVEAADRVAAALLRKFEVEKFLPGDLDESWSTDSRYSCLTGDAQLAGLLIDLYDLGGDEVYLNTALKLNEYVKSTQSPSSSNPGIRWGVKGSDPVWGDYLTYSYPNWAAKFFADALLGEERAMRALEAA